MPITFEPLSGAIEFDEIDSRLRVVGIALDAEIGEGALLGVILPFFDMVQQTSIFDSADLRLPFAAAGLEPAGGGVFGDVESLSVLAAQPTIEPQYTLLVGSLGGFAVEATTSATYMDELSIEVPLAGLLVEPEGDYLLGVLPPFGSLIEQDPPTIENYAYVLMSPGYAYAYGLRFSETLAQRVGALLADVLVFSEASTARLTARQALADVALLGERLTTGFRLVLADGFQLSESAGFSAGALEDLIDYLRFSGIAVSRRNAIAIVVSALALGDLVRVGDAEVLSDQVAFSEALSERLGAAAALVDGLLLGEEFEHSAGFSAAVSESLHFGESASSTAALIIALTEELQVAGRLRIGGEEFYGYVCNTASRAFSTYANFPFNSLATIGGRAFGVADDGLYLLDGDDDDGDPIRSTVRIALTNLGTGKQKRMPSAYIGYSGGRLVLKAITTSATGEKEEFWYAIEERPAAAPRESRIPLGRGLKSVYWGFELVNVDGESFQLDSLQLFPMILERRL
jgi:hypothetical protein